MSYRIAKLVSDYVSPGVFVNRLEIGDSGLGGPVDLRFIGDPGWIENAHSVFFGVDGRDAYYPTNTGGLISTSDAGDLVFFDPSNDVGRTLSQLYAGAGGAYLPLAGGQMALNAIIDMHDGDITNVDKIQGNVGTPAKMEFMGTSAYRIYIDGTTPFYTRYETVNAHEFDVNANQILYISPDGIYMDTGKKITNLANGTAASDAVNYGQLAGYALESWVTTQLAGYLPLVGGTMDALAIINMSGGDVQGLENIQAQGTGGVSLYNSVGSLRGDLASTNYTVRCINAGIDMNANNLSGGKHIYAYDSAPYDFVNILTHGGSLIAYFGETFAELPHQLKMSGQKITGLGEPSATHDAVRVDADIRVPMLQIPLTTKGYLLVGKTSTLADALAPGSNTQVLTLDDTKTLGMKWAAQSGGSGVWQSTGTPTHTSLISPEPVDLTDELILYNAVAGPALRFKTDLLLGYAGTYLYGTSDSLSITDNHTDTIFATFDLADDRLNMRDNKITDLAAGTASSNDAARMVNLDSYHLTSDFNTWRNGTTQIEMGYVNEVSSSIQDQLNARLPLTAGSGSPLSGDLYMGGNDLLGVDKIQGTSGVPLKLEFQDNTYYRIYLDSSAPIFTRYQTVNAHQFDIGTSGILTITTTGIILASGMRIESNTGSDLELRAPSGQMIKFVIG